MRWLVAAALAIVSSYATSPPVSISLETGWSAPPLLLEILETVYDEDADSYFPFLNLVSSHLPSFFHNTDQAVLSKALDLINTHQILPLPSSISTLEYALGLHTASPKIEAAYSWYDSSIDEAKLGVSECESWVEWKGKGFCAFEDLRNDVELSIEDGTFHHETPIRSLAFDHISPGSSRGATSKAILYLDINSPSSIPLLKYLYHHAIEYPSFRYVVRYKPSKDMDQQKKTKLSGYSVELALKKTDYLVVDDRATTQETNAQKPFSAPATDKVQGPFAKVLGEDPWSALSTPLRPTEIMNISVQAASLIMQSEDKLSSLIHLSQDFPKYSAAIARRVTIPASIEERIEVITRRGQTTPAMFVNGKVLPAEKINAFSLLKTIREERQLVLSLVALGYTPSQAFELISDPVIGQAQTEEDPGEGTFDASDRPEGGDVITWWNDVEKDKRYKSWPPGLHGLLRPIYPGQLHTIRKNIWNAILVLDLSQAASLETIASAVSTMIQRGVPIRFGVVPMFDENEDDLAHKMAKVYLYCLKALGRGALRQMFEEIVLQTPSTPTKPGIVNIQTVKIAYEKAVADSNKSPKPFEQILQDPLDGDLVDKIGKYASRLLVSREEAPNGHMFVNGKYHLFGGHWTAIVQSELTTQLQFLQEQLALGIQIEDVSNFFYDLQTVPARRSKLVIPDQESKLRVFNLVELFSMDPTSFQGKLGSDFVYSSDTSRGAPITMWVIADLDSKDGRRVVKDALQHLMSEQCSSRIGFIHNPSPSSGLQGQKFSTMIHHLLSMSALHSTRPENLISLLEEFDSESGNLDTNWRAWSSQTDLPSGQPLHSITSSGWEIADDAAAERFWEYGAEVVDKLGIKDYDPYLLVNGRLVGPLTQNNFPSYDFDVLEVYEHRKRVRPVIDLVSTMYSDMSRFDRPTLGNLISRTSSVLASAYRAVEVEGIFEPTQSARGRLYEKLDNGDLSFEIGDNEGALVHVAAVMDPASPQAQTWAPLLKSLSELDNIALTVYLDPNPQMTEIPLKRFYRTTIAPKPLFDIDGTSIAPPLVFADLPTEPIYTLGMDTPSAWITRPRSSPYDLDNLQLANIRESISINFQLQQLVIEGHAREGQMVPPRGLQLQLTKDGLGVASDTLIMANLGYFQFKVTPGVYDLSIRPGRGQDVFKLESVGSEGWDSPDITETGNSITLMSFDGLTIVPRFERESGMETADVLEETSIRETGILTSLLSKSKKLLGLKGDVGMTKAKHADINIFTVASGLLYERFASIMILSVMKHTKSSVKFWFIENFLSPSFLAFIPHLAEEYGFQYELVTYKWPHWLRAQTEKQRIIWAYKILFLDVLFPMDLNKVIFVDADQIVRVDMKELIDVDLHGRVYGMAPMGNSRTEMEGFRFWKTGYWKEALRGRPYHISALYVVDLKRFRQLATGDRLRGNYQALSADPNSLANLDQDLPNSMQDQIPIWTLDQDWLWCQTWCSDESLATAKTIDLCQNPLTKEPKIARAKSIEEWDGYDREIAAFAAKVTSHSTGGQSLAASVEDLAGEKGPVVIPPTSHETMDDGPDRHLQGEL